MARKKSDRNREVRVVKDNRDGLPPDIAALAQLLGRVRARVILERADTTSPTGTTPPAQPEVPPTRLLLRIEEVAEALAVSRTTVYSLIRSGQLPSIRIGRSTRVSVDSLRAWIDLQEQRATG